MFCVFNDNYLTVERGDSFSFPIDINEGTELNYKKYTLTEFDILYVGIYSPNQPFENSIIRRTLNHTSNTDAEGNILFELVPEDTLNLKTGKYFISIKIKQGKNVYTILPQKEFWILGTDKDCCNCI